MTPDYISLQKEMTVAEALAHIKNVGMDAETVYTCYVKDTGRKLIGIEMCIRDSPWDRSSCWAKTTIWCAS